MATLDFEFKIPLKRDDLRSNESPDQYVVSDIYNLNDLKIKIDECKLCLNENGCDFILEHFPTIFSLLHHFNNLDFKVLRSFYENVIVKELELLFNNLSVILADDDVHPELRIKMLNITKMILYVTVEYLKSFQEKIDKTYSLVINEKRNKNTKLMKLKEEHNWDWEDNERKTLIVIAKIIKLPLQRLWDPPMPEEEFVRMIADCCYNVLEKTSITSTMMKPTKDVVLEILAILLKQYNNAISCKVKIVQLLKLYEHLVVILAQAVVLFVEKYNCRSLVKELIMEIIETEGEVDNYTQDGSSSRAFSNFIVEIAKLQPPLILPCINLLIHNLSCDPYSMRICVLTVMAEIIINALRNEGEELTDENRKMRDNFLDHLLDHVLDINVFVRSRALKLWQAIYKEKAIPTSYIIPLLEQAMGRLHDKSSNVVKNAIQLITIMLEENLYGAALDTETVKQNLRAVKSKLIEEERSKRQPSVFKIWFFSRLGISDYVAKNLKENYKETDPVNITVSNSEQDESSDEEESLSENPANNISENLTNLPKYIINQDLKNIFDILIQFEAENIRKLKLLKAFGDKVRYYEWILGNLCKNGINIREDIIARFTHCEDLDDMMSILNEPVQVEDQEDMEFGKDKGILTYCEDYLRFVETMSSATAIISEILMGKNPVEVMEAIEFFKIAHKFNLSGADEGVRNMLLLINSKEASFKEAVKNTFKTLYLESESDNKYEAATEAANKLISLLKKVTYEQKNALANLIKEWVLNNDIGAELILVLWETYSRKSAKVSQENSTAAAALISMYASGKPEIIKTNIDQLVKYGIGAENQNNYLFLKYTCYMFRALYGLKNENGRITKYPQDSELFEKLAAIVENQFTNLANGLYAEISMEAIIIIYKLSEYPDVTVGKIIKSLYNKLSQGKDDTSNEITCHEEILARFILIIGHVAFCQWQYLEYDVLNELKHRNAEQNAKENKRNKTINKSKYHSNSTRKSISENTTTNDPFEDDNQALVNEQVAESVRMVCDRELIKGETLLAKLSSLILQICQHTKKYNNTRLKSAASLSLSKLMMISSEFCSEHIQLFVTLLERTTEPDVKINLILAFGDLTFRFPNIMDMWTGYFYNRLGDESSNVRYTALIVISHLITNEMVKVRSQMSDVALCLIDSDKLIKNHAHQLFYELSLKGNTLYNVMADIISRLSHPDHRPDEETFQTILKILMKLITKDRHLESIVEKLCHRLRGATDERQCIDLSYCLTLVSYSERSFQKLLDNIACYADKLNYAKVHKNFTTIIIACKKMKAIKMADAVMELENKISIILTKGVDNLDADFLKPPKTPKRVSKTPITPRNRNSSMYRTPQTSARKTRGRSVRKIVEFDSDEGE